MEFASNLTGYMDRSSDELVAIYEAVSGIVDAECTRAALHRYVDGDRSLEDRLWTVATETGWFSIGLPEEAGGLGQGWRGTSVVLTELGRAVAPGAMLTTMCAATALAPLGPDFFPVTWSDQLNAGTLPISLPAGDIPSNCGTKIRMVGNPGAGLAIAPVDEERWGAWRLEPGSVATVPGWDRTRSLFDFDTTFSAPELIFNDSSQVARRLSTGLALAIASDCFGGICGISGQTLDYLKTRHQFGRPLASFQALKHRVADIAAAHASQQQLLVHAIEAADHDIAEAGFWAALARAELATCYAFVAADCVQLHGGIGFTWDYDCHVFLKRAKLNEFLGGQGQGFYDRAERALQDAVRASRSLMEFS